MKMIKTHIDDQNKIQIVLTSAEVRQYWLIQEKIDNDEGYKHSLYKRIEEGMRLLKPVTRGEIELR